jgi:riboflavin kinase/FMN adenylyltransferase
LLVTSSLEEILKPNVIALGNFDGIHQGHQQVLKSTFNQDFLDSISSNIAIYSTVVTFTPHPREFFTGKKKQLLTPLNEKVKLLERLGINQLLLLPFDRELASLTPQKFTENILIDKIDACLISVGQDFRFGHQRKGNAQDLKQIASSKGVKVIVTEEQTLNLKNQQNIRISSSHIRFCLEKGDVETANEMLGYKYSLTGKVIEGKKLGRTLGFPTANLELPQDKFLPRQGVYAVKVYQEHNPNISLKGVMNIGCRPTIGINQTTNQPSVEVHLLNWSGDLYNQILTVEVEKFLRPEQKFSSLEALKQQISNDCVLANLQ